jgi:hypothetical protein
MKVHELTLGKRAGIMWAPRDCARWTAYKGSGHRFLKLGRLTLWVRWAYD